MDTFDVLLSSRTDSAMTAVGAMDSFAIHWDVCRTRGGSDFCQRGDDLYPAAYVAETAMLDACYSETRP